MILQLNGREFELSSELSDDEAIAAVQKILDGEKAAADLRDSTRKDEMVVLLQKILIAVSADRVVTGFDSEGNATVVSIRPKGKGND